jgi:hypothetical protein
LYCLAPGCDCDQAVVDFIELLRGDMEPIGGIRLRVTDAHVLHPDVEPGNEVLVERLWAAYQQRHRDPDRLVRFSLMLVKQAAPLQSRPGWRAPRATSRVPADQVRSTSVAAWSAT